MSWFSIGFVAKIMVAASLLVLFGGAVLLSRIVHGRWSVVALICALLLISRMLLSGLVNYLFGLGLSLLGAAVWIALRERPAILRVAALCGFATAASAIHLLACGVLGIIVTGIELVILTERQAGLHRWLIAMALIGAAFVPAFCLIVLAAPHPDYYSAIVYAGLTSRLAAFAVPLTYAPARGGRWALLQSLLAVLACWLTGRMQLDRRLAAAAGLLALVQL